MLSALSAASEAGINIEKLDPWSRDEDFDIFHVWGLDSIHAQNIHWARQAGKKIVMTALLPYLSVQTRVRAALITGAMCITGRQAPKIVLLNKVDRLVVVNQLQADAAAKLYGFSLDRIKIIPNIVENRFFSSASQMNTKSAGVVLCTGNVCRRKNQLNLIYACRVAGLRLLIIGGVLTGEDAYAAEIERVVANDAGTTWIKGVSYESDKLIEAYRQAAVFALVSTAETQPLALLEAKAAGCRLVIADRAYARDEFFRNAILVKPDSVASIAAGLLRAAGEGAVGPDPDFNQKCSREAVGRAYVKLYHGIVALR